MSSDGNNNLAHEYPAGAYTSDNSNSPHTSAISIIDFTTMQPLTPNAPIFTPRPVTATSSASDIANMFRQLRVHTPAPLTPDGQCVTDEAAEMFSISLTPAKRQGDEAGLGVALGTAAGSTATLGAMMTAPEGCWSHSYDSAADDDLRRCAQCGEQ
jgi:hypothetical protein